MKVYENQSDLKDLFLKVTDVLLPGTLKEKILIYDIDTTAFEAANGCVFLIGAEYYETGELKVKQFFSEDIREELEIIEQFLSFAKDYDVLLNYKGNSFDIPFLAGRLDILKSNPDLTHLRTISYDLFDEIRPVKMGLGLVSTKIDVLRKLTGQIVTEKISGENISKFYVQHIARTKLKNLIAIANTPDNSGFIGDYEPKYLDDDLAHISVSENPSFLQDVLNRNRDNMESVIYIARLAHIFNMRKGFYNVELCNISCNSTDNDSICIGISLPSLNYDLNYSDPNSSKDNILFLKLYIQEVALKQFYINYRDYFYFTAEDMAMHKSVAEFADKNSKKKATPQTAYANITGNFVKIPSQYIKEENKKEGCLYKESYESGNYYLPVNNILNMNNENLKMLTYFCILEKYKDSLSEILI